LLNVTAYLEKLGALVVLAPEAGEPGGATAKDGRDDRDALDVVHRRRAAVEACSGGERRLEPRLALLAFETLDHRGLFAADVGPRAPVDEHIEVVARPGRIL